MKKLHRYMSVILSFVIIVSTVFIVPVEVSATSETSNGTKFSEMLERAEAIINYEWVPSERIYTWNDNPYNGKNYFEAGETVIGMPYTLFSWELGFDSLLSLEQYKEKSSLNYSVSEYCNSVSDNRLGPAYGNCCATFVSEVFGGRFMNGANPKYDGVGTIQSSSFSKTYNNVKLENIQPGDAVSSVSGSHIVWIGDVTDETITLYESTPPICQKVVLDKSSNTNSNGYLTYGDNTYNIVTKSKEIIRDDLSSEYNLLYEIPLPIQAYTKSTSKTVVYDAVNGIAKTNKIYSTDLCFIDAIFDNGWCHVNFPLDAGGIDSGYVQTSVFFNSEYSKSTDVSKSNIPLYSREDLSSVCSRVPNNCAITFVDETDNSYQIIYPLETGGYNLGWVTKDDLSNVQETPLLNQLCPIKCYPCVDENFEVKKSDYVTRGGEIYINDYCTINEIFSDGWCEVTFPLDSGGTLTGYTQLEKFVYSTDYSITTYVTQERLDVYTKKDLKQCNNWWTGTGDTIYIVGTCENAIQICYPIDEAYGGGYKLGWVPESSISVDPETPEEPTLPERNLASIQISRLPNKTEYCLNDDMDATGLALQLNYSDSTNEIITDGFTVSSPDMSVLGTKEVIVSYENMTTAFTITVVDSSIPDDPVLPDKSITSIEISCLPNKIEYFINDDINITGLAVQLNYSDSTNDIVTDGFTVSAPDMSTAGTKEVVVSYGDMTASFNITVSEPEVIAAKYRILDVTGRAGESVEVYVSIEGNPGIISLRNQISYDTSVLDLVKIENLGLLSGYTTPSPTISSPYTLRWADSFATENNTANGNIVKLTFNIKEGTPVGEYEISVTPVEARNVSGEKIEFAQAKSKVTVIDYITGDIDDDGEISDWDAIVLNRYLSGWEVDICIEAADVDNDGEITDWDAIILERYLAGWNVEIG